MSKTITAPIQGAFSSELIKGGIERVLREKGRLPPVSLIITPIESDRPIIRLDNFLDYTFDSSIIIPVDSFSFTFANPDGDPFYESVRDGDLVTLYANEVPIGTGVIDTVEIDTETESGEKVTVSGRDLISYLEDQDAINIAADPIFAKSVSIRTVFNKLRDQTRIRDLELRNVPSTPTGLFATQPGESKLTALQRFLEPFNCLFWSDPSGRLIIGKPNFSQQSMGVLRLNKGARDSNVTSMKVIYAATTIPSIVLPIWTGQENVLSRLKEQAIENKAYGPTRLRTHGHVTLKSVVFSAPNAADPQSLSDVNLLTQNTNVLRAVAQREIARQNQKERIVQIVVPGHYNENGEPYNVDQVYKIQYDRGNVDEDMYLFHVQYSLSEGGGQKTTLHFCNRYTLVAGSRI